MTTLKSLTILAALLAGGTSLAVAQNGPATGGEPPVAGGAGGNPAAPGYYFAAPNYYGAPGYVATPGPGYVAGEPTYGLITHHKKMYMSARGTGGKHTLRTGSAPRNSPKNGGYQRGVVFAHFRRPRALPSSSGGRLVSTPRWRQMIERPSNVIWVRCLSCRHKAVISERDLARLA